MQVALCYVNVDFLQEVCILNKLSFRSKKVSFVFASVRMLWLFPWVKCASVRKLVYSYAIIYALP